MPQIEQIFILPPMAVARLGGSDNALDAFTWIEDPSLHGGGLTVISPTITLLVQPDGSVRPVRRATIAFRDGDLLRPVAPFLELWAKVQGEDDLQPLNLALLESNSAGPENLSFTVTAANRKAARRTGDNACAYSASVTLVGTDHARHELRASSTGDRPLVAADRPIPLGTFQAILAKANRTEMGIDLSLIRVRYTPARGEVYGPPGTNAARDPDPGSGRRHPLVPARNQILNTGSAWTSYDANDARFDSPQPADTYDGADDPSRRELSFGVVDDTCDVLIDAVMAINNNRLTAQARVFCGPPDFAPDRRPFISLADDLVDRDPPPDGQPERLQDALDRLGDLFQRAYETASLANLDFTRDTMMSGQDASRFPPATTLPESMSPADSNKYFDRADDFAAVADTHLPYAELAHDVHLSHTDVEDMVMLLQSKPDFVRRLIRPPYGAFSELLPRVAGGAAPNPSHRDPRVDRDGVHDMRMPPYMRDSDASPLSLTRRQYKFLMNVLDRLQKPSAADTVMASQAARRGGPAAPPKVRTPVRAHVERVAGRRRGPNP